MEPSVAPAEIEPPVSPPSEAPQPKEDNAKSPAVLFVSPRFIPAVGG